MTPTENSSSALCASTWLREHLPARAPHEARAVCALAAPDEVASANRALVVASCEKHGVNAIDYLTDVLLRVQTHPASKIDELLLHPWKPPDRVPPDGLSEPRNAFIFRAFTHLTIAPSCDPHDAPPDNKLRGVQLRTVTTIGSKRYRTSEMSRGSWWNAALLPSPGRVI